MFSYIVVTLVAIASIEALVLDGKCPEFKANENFDVEQYRGIWYEIMKLPYPDPKKSSNCVQAEYTPEGDQVKVKNTHVVNGSQEILEGTAKFAEDANKAAKWIVTFKFGGNIADVVKEVSYLILATDYKNYAITYTCKYDEKANNHQTQAWILSRSKKLEGDVKVVVDNFLKANPQELDSSKFLETDFSEEASSPVPPSTLNHTRTIEF